MIDYDELVNFRSSQPPMTDEAFLRGMSRVEAASEQAVAMQTPHRSRHLLIAAAIAIAVFAGGAVALGSHHPADTAAAEVLKDAASRALLGPALQPRPGQFVYQRVETFNNGDRGTVEYWIPADHSRQETICVSDSGCATVPYDPTAVKNQGLPYDVLCSLPTTGSGMLDYLRSSPITVWERSLGESANLAVWNTALQLGDLLPPAQQAALFQALTRLHGIHTDGTVTTFDGRAGIAIAIKSAAPKSRGGPSIANQLVFAVENHSYIGERNLQTFSASQSAGSTTVSFNSSATTRVVVDRAQLRP
jgi:hypothetical protein